MKLSRPLSAREAVVHLFAFEYFQDGLIVVVANTISDLDSVDRSTHCYSKDEIHNVQDVVRVDLVGGFALQKVTDNRSYFRTIGNMDIKLDFIPPALINFVARQLIGGGFNLYKKEVASVAKGDEDFSKALKDPLYARIREALYSDKIPNGDIALQLQDLKKNAVALNEETRINNDEKCPEQKVHSEIEVIEDEACEKMECQNQDDRNIHDSPVNQLVQKTNKNGNVGISPEVKHALETLDKAISIIREYRCNLQISTVCDNNIMSLEAEPDSLKDRRNVGDLSEVFEQEFREVVSYEHNNSFCSRCMSSSLCTMEPSHNKIGSALPDVYAAIPGDEAHHIALCASTDQETAGEIMEKILQDDNVTVANEDDIHEKELHERKIRKQSRYCCLYFLSGKVVA